MFQNNIISSINMTAHTQEKENIRLNITKDLFDEIYIASIRHKEKNIKKLREELYPLVENVKSEKDLENISWNIEIIEPVTESIRLRKG